MSESFQDTKSGSVETATKKPHIGIIPGVQGVREDFDSLIEECAGIADFSYFPRPTIPIPTARDRVKWEQGVLQAYLADLPPNIHILFCHSRGCKYGLQILKTRSEILGAILVSPPSNIPRRISRELYGPTERGTTVENLLLPLLTTMEPETRKEMLIRHAEACQRDPNDILRIVLELQLLRSEPAIFELIGEVTDQPLLVINAESDPFYIPVPAQPNVTTITAKKGEKQSHYPHVDSVGKIADHTVSFLKKLQSS